MESRYTTDEKIVISLTPKEAEYLLNALNSGLYYDAPDEIKFIDELYRNISNILDDSDR